MVASLMKMAGPDWAMPDFTTLCRRQKILAVQIPYRRPGGPLNLLVGSTGIKFLGDGEWQARKHDVRADAVQLCGGDCACRCRQQDFLAAVKQFILARSFLVSPKPLSSRQGPMGPGPEPLDLRKITVTRQHDRNRRDASPGSAT